MCIRDSVIGDHRRVARVVLRNTRFDLTDQISADIRALGEDTAAETGKDRDQRAAKGQSNQWAEIGSGAGKQVQQYVVASYAEQTEADYQHPGNGAAAKSDFQRRIQTVMGLSLIHI